jgi:hypothetical protein
MYIPLNQYHVVMGRTALWRNAIMRDIYVSPPMDFRSHSAHLRILSLRRPRWR